MLNEQNYNLLCQLGLQVVNGIVTDQETNEMVKNVETGKYMIVRVPDTYVDFRYYEEFNPYYNFKQLKALVGYYLNKLAVLEGRYFQVLATDAKDEKLSLIAKNEYEEVQTRYFDRDKGYLCYIDLLYCLDGEYDTDMDIYTRDREEFEGKMNKDA